MEKTGESPEMLKAEKRIKGAGFAGLALVLLILIQFFFPFATGLTPAAVAAGFFHAASDNSSAAVTILGIPPYFVFSFLSLLLVAGMTFGVFKKNAICCVVLFCYSIVSFVFSLSISSIISAVPTAILIAVLVFLFFGLLGTFDYQHFKQQPGEPGQNAA